MSEYLPEITTGYVVRLRKAEVEGVKIWFFPKAHVLEIGGGSGYQASIIAAWGCDIVSIDIPGETTSETLYYPVREYDGKHIPFADESFDIVFSSNVMEHVKDLPTLLAETRRILRPEGLAIHIVPTPAWRFWHSLGAPFRLSKLLLRRIKRWLAPSVAPSITATPSTGKAGSSIGKLKQAWAVVFPGAHGDYPNAPSELYYFSRRRWVEVFEGAGFEPIHIADNELFYTGNVLIPSMPLSVRRSLAHFLGAACHVFVLRQPIQRP